MIISFKDKETEKIYNQEVSTKIPSEIQKSALRKLILIDNAASINDLRTPPGNRLESLVGERSGQYSIRINNKFRICFKLNAENEFYDVEIVDYHR